MKLLLSAILLNIAFSCFSADGKQIPYDKINMLIEFVENEKHSPFTYLNSSVDFEEGEPLKIWISGAVSQELTLSEQNKLVLPLLSKKDAEKSTLNFNRKDNEVALTLKLSIKPPQQNTNYIAVFSALEDVNAVQRKAAGYLSWLVPDIDTLQFQFSKPASISFLLENGELNYNTDANNTIEIKYDQKIFKENPELRFSSLPTEVSAL